MNLKLPNSRGACNFAVFIVLSGGLRPGSEVCSENMTDWQYLLLPRTR